MESSIICGDALEELKRLPSESVDCVITSPPYWGLRDYGTAKWEGGDKDCKHTGVARRCDNQDNSKSSSNRGSSSDKVSKDCIYCDAKRIDDQIGLEKTPEEYVNKMVEVFREVKRVLKKEGTLWLNLGDSYNSQPPGNKKPLSDASGLPNSTENLEMRRAGYVRPKHISGLKPKDLVGIPWRVAFALQADGWYLRQDIIWAKPNPMPESVTDRCTKSHEYVFLLSKSQKYYFDNEAIKEKYASEPHEYYAQKLHSIGGTSSGRDMEDRFYGSSGRNKRSIWTITTKPFSEAHFATFPEDLIEPMIKAGTSEKGICPECGKAWVRIVEKEKAPKDVFTKRNCPTDGFIHSGSADYGEMMGHGGKLQEWRDEHPIKTLGWKPSCSCGKEPIPAIVLDPFAGSGTALVVAKRLKRNFLGIELNPEYVRMAERSLISMRDSGDMKTLKEIESGKQRTLLWTHC